MKCSKVIEILEKQSPRNFACDWDNEGLLVGRTCLLYTSPSPRDCS